MVYRLYGVEEYRNIIWGQVDKVIKVDKTTRILEAIVAILAIIAGVSHLPTWFMVLIGIFIMILLVQLVYPPISTFIKGRTTKRKYDNLAKKYFNEFREFVDRFDELLHNRYNNIPSVLNKLRASDATEFKDIHVVNQTYINNHFGQGIVKDFKEMLNRFDGTKKDLVVLISLFESIFYFYNDLCICGSLEGIKNKDRTKIKKNIKDEYSEYKHTYISLIGDYIKFSNRLNKEFGEKICRPDFEKPRDL